jgi:hypothetical protein
MFGACNGLYLFECQICVCITLEQEFKKNKKKIKPGRPESLNQAGF